MVDTVGVKGATTVVDKNAESDCPDGKLAHLRVAMCGTNDVEESTNTVSVGNVFTYYALGGVVA